MGVYVHGKTVKGAQVASNMRSARLEGARACGAFPWGRKGEALLSSRGKISRFVIARVNQIRRDAVYFA